MGLDGRLRMARVLVLVRAGETAADASRLARAGVVVYESLRFDGWPQPTGGRQTPLLGLRLDGSAAGRRLAEDLQPDLILDGEVPPGWPHQWVLRGRTINQVPPRTDDPMTDFWVVEPAGELLPLVQGLTEALPPSDPVVTPWFVLVDGAAAAEMAVAAGAVRVAVTGADASVVEGCDALLRSVWREPAMRAYALAALQPRAGRPGGGQVMRHIPLPDPPARWWSRARAAIGRSWVRRS